MGRAQRTNSEEDLESILPSDLVSPLEHPSPTRALVEDETRTEASQEVFARSSNQLAAPTPESRVCSGKRLEDTYPHVLQFLTMAP